MIVSCRRSFPSHLNHFLLLNKIHRSSWFNLVFSACDPPLVIHRVLEALFSVDTTFLVLFLFFITRSLRSNPHCKNTTVYRKFETNILRNETARPSFPKSYIHVSVSDLYIFSRSVCLFVCSKIGELIVGVHKLLTDTWMWKGGTRPRSFMSGNISIGSSLQCSPPWKCLLVHILFLYNFSISVYF
jgi:hypothetical protein